jgi:hypothetical protein
MNTVEAVALMVLREIEEAYTLTTNSRRKHVV